MAAPRRPARPISLSPAAPRPAPPSLVSPNARARAGRVPPATPIRRPGGGARRAQSPRRWAIDGGAAAADALADLREHVREHEHEQERLQQRARLLEAEARRWGHRLASTTDPAVVGRVGRIKQRTLFDAIANPPGRHELATWLRYSHDEAPRRRDGAAAPRPPLYGVGATRTPGPTR